MIVVQREVDVAHVQRGIEAQPSAGEAIDEPVQLLAAAERCRRGSALTLGGLVGFGAHCGLHLRQSNGSDR